MIHELRMPELGSDVAQADLVQWLVAAGDTVAEGDLIAEFETDKSTVEFESPVSGVVAELCVEAPATGVSVGDLIARIELAEDAAEDDHRAPAPPPSAAPATPAERIHEPAPETAAGARSEPVSEPESKTAPARDTAAPSEAPAAAGNDTAADAAPSVPATALARRIAEQGGIDLRSVEPTGAGGRVTKADVEAAGEQPPAARAPAQSEIAGQTIRLSRMRRTIARRMSEAKRDVPHFYLEARCNARQLLDMRAKLNAEAPRKLSVNDFCVAAAARALRDVPRANVAWREDAIEQYATCDVAVAVATDDGLITPVMRDAAGLGLIEISERLGDLIERARAGRLDPNEYHGGLAVSNLGMFGVTAVWPIVNPPHACILGIGGVEEVPVVEDGAVVPGVRMTCTLSADHRAVDGAVGAQLLAAFRRYVEDPLEMIL